MLSPVTLVKAKKLQSKPSTDIVLCNAQQFVWPLRADNSRCLQFDCDIGHVEAFERKKGLARIQVDHSTDCDRQQVVTALGLAFSFWSGCVAGVVAYETSGDQSYTRCIFPPANGLQSRAVAPPLGHAQPLRIELNEFHEHLLAKATNFFYGPKGDEINSLLYAFLCSVGSPFTTHCLVACSVLEGLAKQLAPHGESSAITDNQKCMVKEFLEKNDFGEELKRRFSGFMDKLNEPSGANAISQWVKTGFLGITLDDERAWKKLRNPAAHGKFSLFGGTYEAKQKRVSERSRVHNMINKLMLHAIGYAGKYFDYSTWSVAEFGPSDSSGKGGSQSGPFSEDKE